MDVICERCGTEYEFDDALLSERGTTVKCTSCGHQFKIYRPSKATPEELTRTWNLRRPDGTVIPFDSLAVLQKWIMEGRVSKMDEICRPGETWKALGAIAELDSFFVTAESRNAQVAPRASARPPANKGSLAPGSLGPLRAPTPAKATLPGGTPVPPPGTKASLPPMGVQPLRAPTPPLGSLSPAKGSLPPGSTSPVRAPTPPGLRAPAPKTPSVRPPTPLGSLRQGPPAPPPPAAPAGTATPSGNALRAASGGLQIPPPPRLPADLPGVPSLAADPAPPRLDPPEPAIERRREMAIGPPPRMELDEIGPRAPRNVRDDLPADEDATQSASPESLGLVPPRRRGVGVAVGVTLGLLVAVGVGFAAFRSGLLDGQSAPRAEAVNVGPQRDAVLRHARAYTRQGFEDARVELAQALALSPDHPQLLALRASLDAAAAEMLRAQADDLDQQARAPGADAEADALRAQAVSLRRDADERIPRARADAQAAARAPTPRAEADRVELAALLGDVARITGDAETAQRHAETVRASQPRSVEADLLLGLLARDAGNHAEAATALRSVLARSPGHPRATLSLARVLVAQGDVLAARAELDGLLRASPGHEAATALSQARAAADAVAAAPVGTEPPAAPAQPAAATAQPPTPPAQPAVAVAQPPAAPAQPAVAAAQPPAEARPARHSDNEIPHGASYDQLVAEGDRLQNQGRSSVARERYQAALAQRPGGPEALVGLGHAALDAGDTALAIARFRQALSSSPRYADAYIGLGEAYGHNRAYRPSLQAFQRYLEINPSGTHAGMARRQIQALEERLRDSPGSEPSPPPSEP